MATVKQLQRLKLHISNVADRNSGADRAARKLLGEDHDVVNLLMDVGCYYAEINALLDRMIKEAEAAPR